LGSPTYTDTVASSQEAEATVIATVRSERDISVAKRAGAHWVVAANGLGAHAVLDRLRADAPEGVDHIVV
jgi:hypothetical protein